MLPQHPEKGARSCIRHLSAVVRWHGRGFRTDWARRSAHENEHLIEDDLATAGKVRLAVRACVRTRTGP